jgi:hypothetical protein
MTRLVAGATLSIVMVLALRGELHAQLLSPGELAASHAELEGLRNCTSCHQLGKSGVSAEKCLSCHEELRVRIDARRGYHASLPDGDCASCHQDHLGDDFALVRFDERSLDHGAVGFELELSHAQVDCRGCHEPSLVRDPLVIARKTEHGTLDRTFLGLPNDCAGCHRAESPHGEQFGSRGCADCHDAGAWDEPPLLDHSTTAFALEGRHADVVCAACHGTGPSARYRPLPFSSCADCHADPHGGGFAGRPAKGGCEACHTVEAFAPAPGFDHDRDAAFRLEGAHATAPCRACHAAGADGPAYRPLSTKCESCHGKESG